MPNLVYQIVLAHLRSDWQVCNICSSAAYGGIEPLEASNTLQEKVIYTYKNQLTYHASSRGIHEKLVHPNEVYTWTEERYKLCCRSSWEASGAELRA